MYFPNRSLLLGFSWSIKEGSPRKHTQSVQRPLWWPGPGAQGPFENSSGFTIKVKIYFFILTDRKICNGKNKGLALLDPFSYCFKMTLQKNVLLIDLRPCFHFYFSLLLQKTFLLIDLRPCFHFDDLLERFSIHLHYTLTLCTYTEHLHYALYTYTRNFKRS